MKPEEIKRHKISWDDDPARDRDQRSNNPDKNHLRLMQPTNKCSKKP